ncbi:flagellar basal body L-ring protein FlgH [Thalassotalea sp. PLHSN55]|uniref:flagellar basal body L-ring protein FlgH n=1 Tax=Thalassotalea sp. PLHSN55 TaxID=3435888 RepID=UPI003F8286EE
MLAKYLVTLQALLLLSACSSTYQPFEAEPGEDEWAPTVTNQPVMLPQTTAAQDGSLLQKAELLTLFQDRRAYDVGDILTVILEEETQSNKRANTGVKKQSDFAANYNGNFTNSTLNGSLGIGGDRNFSGSANSSQQNTLTGAITVTVAEVLPTGALRVKGEKWIKLNQGDEYVRLTGLIRVEDVDQANRISSRRIADARIAYAGRGVLAQSNEQGWLSNFFNSSWFPF